MNVNHILFSGSTVDKKRLEEEVENKQRKSKCAFVTRCLNFTTLGRKVTLLPSCFKRVLSHFFGRRVTPFIEKSLKEKESDESDLSLKIVQTIAKNPWYYVDIANRMSDDETIFSCYTSCGANTQTIAISLLGRGQQRRSAMEAGSFGVCGK